MPGFEHRFEPLGHFRAKFEAGGAGTVIYGADADEGARAYVSGDYYGAGEHQALGHTGTLVVARHESAIEIIHADIPEQEGRGPEARERAMVLLTFAMLTDDSRNGKWTVEDQIFINPDNESAVDPAYVALLGINRKRRVRRLNQGEVVSEELHMVRPAHRIAGDALSGLRRVQVSPDPSPFPGNHEVASTWLEAERDIA